MKSLAVYFESNFIVIFLFLLCLLIHQYLLVSFTLSYLFFFVFSSRWFSVMFKVWRQLK